MYNNLISEDYLMHYGVKGMKWGVRRYQNYDGSLTEQGKLYYNSDGSLTRRGKKERKAFNRAYRRNFYKSYNEATREFNNDIKKINNKPEYKNYSFDKEYSTKTGQKYIKDVNNLWQTSYTKALEKNYGSFKVTPEDLITNAPFMNQYARFIK